MSDSEKSHNVQVERIMKEKVRTWQPFEGHPGSELCYRDGKLVIRHCAPPTTLVEDSRSKGADR